MKSRIWRLAGVGLLCVSVSAQVLADDRDNRNDGRGGSDGGQHGGEGHPGRGQGRGENQPPRPQTEIIRGDNSQQFERNVENGRWQNHGPNDQERGRPAQPSANLPIQGRPDTVRQTQEPRQGYYQDIPRRNDYNPHWQAGGPGSRPYDYRWPGRPEGRGNGWGPGPQYRPGYVIDRFPDRHYRVPYRGRDYYFSGGYWYRPEGPRYVVVRPPYGIRVAYLPDYAREVWIGSALFFLAAGAYYSYEASTQQYVVVEPPVASPPPQAGNDYNVLAYPVSGQSPQQINQDRYDCYRWAVQQSGFDPAAMTYPPAPQVVQTYRQAQGGCLSSRGYQVTY
ncbi:DUF6515 family protein [Pseudomonas chlororaphis]|uniref:DUF6515 family protein n=1 Tax=Pseudomonas chlororaphis TaxID=587753 RepID=UPI0006A639F1|nr:DUF6515 family protein [Pseudomonas chlororaphis]AZD04656.1 hypothetical protein C4K27_5497 [Pseudomonas chlororaphis subsp. chlororaphis]MBM0285590.1 glycine zipper family protein [Pseudomonas chlororaphis]MDO1508271.1 glycine zipper family protein [Pseudomonas chlororaphis]ORM47244.1 glycine zipper family protein [Pseudomonas chlororaphis subsp. chlororaphis]TWR89573.1 glycine zipper family protein [Pseudomonas chlororaphis subsp. chlororaphis]